MLIKAMDFSPRF